MPSGDDDVGLLLDPTPVAVETHTKSCAVLKAAVLVLDNVEDDEVPPGGRRMIKSSSISVGDARVFARTQVQFSKCQNF